MAIVSVRIPQMGEGLQEARLVAFLKQPGEQVAMDEPIYQMETDKAVLDVESPVSGVLLEWTAQPDDILPIGAEVARIETASAADQEQRPAVSPTQTSSPLPTEPAAAAPSAFAIGGPLRNADASPRVAAYARSKGLTDDLIRSIPRRGERLTQEDVDAFLSRSADAAYDEAPLPQRQRVLASRLVRARQLAVPSQLTVVAPWAPVERLKARMAAAGGDFQPSAFTVFAYAAARALPNHPALRSQLIGDATVRTYRSATLGIAVARENDELVLAAVPEADRLEWRPFAEAVRRAILEAREGRDQASEAVTLSLTNLQAQGVRDGLPVVVPPAVGTLLLGEPHWAWQDAEGSPVLARVVCLTLAFDHRLMNGMGAAAFVNEVRANLAAINRLIPIP
ncbi:MAG: 2-oxo acid dehydrogenase subunit E2 [Fimbriimonadales bacterium]|nr:2-oxo acid dehydrogenase subunit E2 [Fimbriimonadales bacterium]